MTKITSFRGQNAFLSNFYMIPITWSGEEYPSLEHAYQAIKVEGEEERERIRTARTPGEAKRIARTCLVNSSWHEVKRSIMHQLVFHKFNSHKYLKERLLATGNAELIEENNWNDTYWGVCNGVGENELGKILMAVRAGLMIIDVNKVIKATKEEG